MPTNVSRRDFLKETVLTTAADWSLSGSQALREICQFKETRPLTSANEILDSAMALVRQLPVLADDDKNLADIGRAFQILNLHMFVRFRSIQKRKRFENKVSGGVITFGDAPPPTTKYSGPTAPIAVKNQRPRKTARSKGKKSSEQESESGSDGEAHSSRNVGLHDSTTLYD